MENIFLPGTLVRARKRDWIVQAGSSAEWLKLRPMGGAEDEVTELAPELEIDPVVAARFPYPDPKRVGPFFSSSLLYDALRFQLRNGAGPFRSFGSIAVEPRSYQLVPLLMAMRQEVVRLLIADDVGIGKTIEAGLIVRELLERGEIKRFAVLCPPHLVDQWVSELELRFNLKAEAVTAGTAARLERLVPHGKSIADVFPYLVVSLDYIKSERHRDYFKAMDFEMVVVDEAHTCTKLDSAPKAKQLRYELLRDLSEDADRHMILLTATPHSGNREGFYSLLALLKPEFAQLSELDPKNLQYVKLRQELAKHFVQRRRIDIAEWRVDADDRVAGFPVRMTAEKPYAFSKETSNFVEAVRTYCVNLLQNDATEAGNSMLSYVAIAMLRCASSSPAAAVRMLRNRLSEDDGESALSVEDAVHDEFAPTDEAQVNDVEPSSLSDKDSEGRKLLALAEELEKQPKKDKKLQLVLKTVEDLIQDGYHPVVFCRYVATAHYVADALSVALKKQKGVVVECVTGEFVPEERKAKIDALGSAEKRVLVATDCLSEGINLQQCLNAVVHYDLAWNPTRHEQREGRIDRFGQHSSEVRTVMIYGEDNPVDGFILDVILRKSEIIRRSLGVTVPVPVDEALVRKALLAAALFNRRAPKEETLFSEEELAETDAHNKALRNAVKTIESGWTNALDKMSKTNTIFAQKSIHPDEVYPLWHAQQVALGSHSDVVTFCREAAAGLGFSFEPQADGSYRLPLDTVKTDSIAVRLSDEGFGNNATVRLDELHRSSPLVSALAEGIVNEAMSGDSCVVVRSAVTESTSVEMLSRVYLLRLRYQIRVAYRNRTQRILTAEEILPVAAVGTKTVSWDCSAKVRELVKLPAQGNLSADLASRHIAEAEALLDANADRLRTIADERAVTLLDDHNRTKEFTARGSVVAVEPCLPVDVMGVFVILPSDD